MTPLTAERLRELLHYEPSTGVFTRRRDGAVAGYKHRGSGYVRLRVDGTKFQAHRLAWLYMTGEWPKDQIDHKDGVTTHNWIDNLRDVTQPVNNQNRRRAKGSTGFLGVSVENDGAFAARIMIDRKTKWLGRFSTPQAAHEAYMRAKRELHEGCAF